MTKEDKDLLLKDLCARLPYNVKIQSLYGEIITSDLNTFPFSMEEMDKEDMWDQLSVFKPYLRSISKLTEEEQFQLGRLIGSASYNMLKGDYSSLKELLEYVYKNHIDLFGLVTIGLALEASKEMYDT